MVATMFAVCNKIVRFFFFFFQSGGQHVQLCELKIQTIKRRLFKLMRIKRSRNWAIFLPKVLDSINKTPNEGIGKSNF